MVSKAQSALLGCTLESARDKPVRMTALIINEDAEDALSAAKNRVLDAALDLFNEFGVAGTSLQMIADGLGVSKAAVYHQFKTKDEIVLTIGRFLSAQLDRIAGLAEAEASRQQALDVLIDEMIALAVDNRRLASFLQRDHVVLKLFETHKPFRDVMDRLNRLIMGRAESAKARVTAAALMIVFGGVVTHPLVSDIDDEMLRRQLIQLSRHMIGLSKS